MSLTATYPPMSVVKRSDAPSGKPPLTNSVIEQPPTWNTILAPNSATTFERTAFMLHLPLLRAGRELAIRSFRTRCGSEVRNRFASRAHPMSSRDVETHGPHEAWGRFWGNGDRGGGPLAVLPLSIASPAAAVVRAVAALAAQNRARGTEDQLATRALISTRGQTACSARVPRRVALASQDGARGGILRPIRTGTHHAAV